MDPEEVEEEEKKEEVEWEENVEEEAISFPSNHCNSNESSSFY